MLHPPTHPPALLSDPDPHPAENDAVPTPTQQFTEHRDLLFSIVYNMLGTVTDTDDVLQETWLAWTTRNRNPQATPIENPRSYLIRIAVNRALDHQATLSRRRETYVGPWLPEPVATHHHAPTTETTDAADTVVHAEAVSLALLVVLETLSPLERAVFVLYEVFGYSHAETAHLLGRTPTAIRQLAHRARNHVHARQPRYEPDPTTRRQITEHFLTATRTGDINALLNLLTPDVTLQGDSNGMTHPASGPHYGDTTVAHLLTSNAQIYGRHLAIAYTTLNGHPAALMHDHRTTQAAVVLDLTPTHHIEHIYIISNPHKLAHLTLSQDIRAGRRSHQRDAAPGTRPAAAGFPRPLQLQWS